MERVLTLNASYMPLGVIGWQRAVCLLCKGVAYVVEESERIVRSPSMEIRVPAIVRLASNVFVGKHRVRLNRRNVFHRDDYTCQYCGKKFPASKLNLDHVIPASQGGKKVWSNIVTSCVEDNSRKAGRTPREAGMRLIRAPQPPTWTVADKVSTIMSDAVPESWKMFLPQLKKR